MLSIASAAGRNLAIFSNYGGNRILNVNYLLSHTKSNSSSKRKNSLKPQKKNIKISKKDVSITAKIIRDGKAINVKGGLDFSYAVFNEGVGGKMH